MHRFLLYFNIRILLQMSDTLIQFYKMRVGYFYGAQVDQIDFSSILKVIFRCIFVTIICGARTNRVKKWKRCFFRKKYYLFKRKKHWPLYQYTILFMTLHTVNYEGITMKKYIFTSMNYSAPWIEKFKGQLRELMKQSKAKVKVWILHRWRTLVLEGYKTVQTKHQYRLLQIRSTHCKYTVSKIWTKYSQKWNWAATFPISTFMSLWAIYCIYSYDWCATAIQQNRWTDHGIT